MAPKRFLSIQLRALNHFTAGEFTPSNDVNSPTFRKSMTIFHIALKVLCVGTVFGGAIFTKNLRDFSLSFTEFDNLLLGFIKYGILLWNKHKVYKLIKMIEIDRLKFSDNDSFLETGTGITRKIFFTYMIFCIIAIVGYFTSSFKGQDFGVDSKWSLVAVYTPFDYYIKERYGVIEFSLQLLIVYQSYCHVFLDLISASIFIFISLQFKTVAHLFEVIEFNKPNQSNALRTMERRVARLDYEGRPAMPNDLMKAIIYHKLLLKCAQDLQHVWRYIFFFQILESCLPFCLLLYLILYTADFTYDEMWEFFGHFNFLVYHFFQLWLMTSCADETRCEALLVSEGAYFSNWTEGCLASRKQLLNVIQRANKPLPFSALGVFPVDMETFISILRAAYGAFALMRNFT